MLRDCDSRRPVLRLAAIACAFALVGASLGGCAQTKNLFGIGKEKKAAIPGERVSVLVFDKKLEADPKLANVDVRLPPPYENAEWPQPGGYASNAMYHLSGAPTLSRVWRSSVGRGADSLTRILAPPVIADGRIFALDAAAHVSALDEATGKRLWRKSLRLKGERADAGFGGGIAYEDGRLFVTTGFGRIHALDATTGAEIWRRDIIIPFRSAPTVNGGRVFAVTQDNELQVLATDDGRVLWTHQGITEQAGLLANASPAVSGDVVVVPYSSGELYAFRVQNGRMAWTDSLTRTGTLNSLSTINDIAGRPVIDRDRVYAVSHSGRLVSIDLRSGERVWTLDVAGIQTPWVAGDYLYVVTTDAELLCVDAQDGRVRWITPLQRFRKEKRKRDPIVWSGPVLMGDRLVIVNSLGRAFSVSPYSGALLSEMKLSDPTFVAPIVAQGTLYILTEDANLVAMR